MRDKWVVLPFLSAAAVVLFSALPVQGNICVVAVEGPESAFIYRTRHGISSTWSELTEADEALPNVYNRGYVDLIDLRWNAYPPEIWENTEYHFSTYIRSTVDQTLTFMGGGDDGVSLFVDGVREASAFYGQGAFTYTLNLTAGEVHKITYAGYNFGGGFDLYFIPVLRNVENLVYNADGFPSEVPEPATLAIWGVFGCIGLVAGYRRRRRTA